MRNHKRKACGYTVSSYCDIYSWKFSPEEGDAGDGAWRLCLSAHGWAGRKCQLEEPMNWEEGSHREICGVWGAWKEVWTLSGRTEISRGHILVNQTTWTKEYLHNAAGQSRDVVVESSAGTVSQMAISMWCQSNKHRRQKRSSDTKVQHWVKREIMREISSIGCKIQCGD